MKFPYKSQISVNPITKEKDIVYRPFIPVDIGYKGQWLSVITGGYIQYLDALIDSGADNNLGPMDIASILKISFEGLKPHKVTGIDGLAIKTFFVPIALCIGGFIYETHMGFAKEITDVLLGGQGFFDKWKIKLEYAKDIELKPTEPVKLFYQS